MTNRELKLNCINSKFDTKVSVLSTWGGTSTFSTTNNFFGKTKTF